MRNYEYFHYFVLLGKVISIYFCGVTTLSAVLQSQRADVSVEIQGRVLWCIVYG